MKNKKLPIGYYLKKVDNLLTEGINQIHKEHNINRTQWQILNSVKENPGIAREQIAGLLSEFDRKEAINQAISNLVERGLIHENAALNLTSQGEELFEICLKKQTAFRQKAMKNITEEEYNQIIATLEKIIENLE